MELFEVQTVELLREYRVSLPISGIADSREAARALCAEIGGRSWVVLADTLTRYTGSGRPQGMGQ